MQPLDSLKLQLRGGAGRLGQPVVWVKSMLIKNLKKCRKKLIFENLFPYFEN